MTQPVHDASASAVEADDRARLLGAAREAILSGLSGERGAPTDDAPASGPLTLPFATFVTLRRHGELRGCIGSLEAERSLLESVRYNARRAAFHDPRFPPLTREELDGLELEISILSPMQPIDATSRPALLAALRPGHDGLLIEQGPRRATFLPGVWRSLDDPDRFLDELFRKAGIAAQPWPADLQAWRYTAEEID